MKEKLKPCPICKTNVEVQSAKRPDEETIFCFQIKCNCGLAFTKPCPSPLCEKEILDNLIKIWNNLSKPGEK